MKRKVLKPNVIRGGVAVPMGDNMYLMKGKTHKQGGIDIGSNPKNGLEVETEEVMKVTNKDIKVFSAVPLLNGESPAKKVLGGDNPNKVFKEQEAFKTRNGLNDDGTNKDKSDMKKFKTGGGKKIKTIENPFDKRTPLGLTKTSVEIEPPSVLEGGFNGNTRSTVTPPPTTMQAIGKGITNAVGAVKTYAVDNPNTAMDTVGFIGNTVGSILGNRANKRMLDDLEFSPPPVARTATKLKTNVNINPQLDVARETQAAYERDIDAGTASSRVALARKQRGRVATQAGVTNLQGQKENAETQLINADRMNQQEVSNANTSEYNQWVQGKTNFNNAVLEKRSENSVGLIEGVNRGVQDVLSRVEKRDASDQTIKAMLAGNPNVSAELLKASGIRMPKTKKKSTKRNNKLPE